MASWRPSPDAPLPPPKPNSGASWRPSPGAPLPPPKPNSGASWRPSPDPPSRPPKPNTASSWRPFSDPPPPPRKLQIVAGLRLLSNAPVPTPKHGQHSTLEVDLNRWLEHDAKSAPTVGQDPNDEKAVSHDDEKITSYGNGKIISYSDSGKQAIVTDGFEVNSESYRLPEERKTCGLRRKNFLILWSLILVLIIAGTVGGGVGGTVDARKKGKIATVLSSTPAPISPIRYTNTGLSAMQWTDLHATLHKRVYYQDNSNKIRESSWDNSTAFDAAWQVNTIGGSVKPGTPIAAAAGYPHAKYNYSLVKDVFYMSTDDELSARQAPSNNSQAWVDDNFSGLYSGTNSTFLAAYWNQNIQNVSQELVLLFQEDNFANGLTQGRYVSNKTTSNPWVANNFGFSQLKGSTFAMSLISYMSGKHLMLYTIGDGNILQQHEYVISDTDLTASAIVSLISESSTGLSVQPQSPLTVVSQDNQPLYTQATLPECTHNDDLRATNLILFAVPNCSSLVLYAWNCSSGYLDQTAEIQPLQKANTTYLSLASTLDRATGDGSVYIMFDSGHGPQVEEWTVPKRAGNPWITSRNVTTDFGL